MQRLVYSYWTRSTMQSLRNNVHLTKLTDSYFGFIVVLIEALIHYRCTVLSFNLCLQLGIFIIKVCLCFFLIFL